MIMIPMRSIGYANQKRIRQSICAYFEGLKELNWILGIIGTEDALAYELLLTRFEELVNTPRHTTLKSALEARLTSRTRSVTKEQEHTDPAPPSSISRV